MMTKIDQLVKTLLQKSSLDDCSLPELRQFADRHPYFGAAQLLLTKKLQTENDPAYDDQLQKTFTFFHNPMWVEQLLGNTGTAEVVNGNGNHSMPVIQEKMTAAVEQYEANTPLPLQEEPAKVVSMTKHEKENDLLFEPFHTVDYFASQGIKLKEEEKTRDKFGQQLKSFTEWLKTMKKLPKATLETAPTSLAERNVEEMAAVSLKEGEVLTESMAEVWEKQGNALKAIDIYNKLSLLEPSKSSYFAAKIEALKKSQT